MRTLIVLTQILLIVAWSGGIAYAYTMKISINEERIHIQRPVPAEPGVYAQQDVNIAIRAQGLNGAPWRLQIQALEDAQGPEPIPAGAFTWKALNSPFVDGQLVTAVPQLLAQGTGDIDTVGRIRFKFKTANYAPGDYISRLKFTLSSP